MKIARKIDWISEVRTSKKGEKSEYKIIRFAKYKDDEGIWLPSEAIAVFDFDEYLVGDKVWVDWED